MEREKNLPGQTKSFICSQYAASRAIWKVTWCFIVKRDLSGLWHWSRKNPLRSNLLEQGWPLHTIWLMWSIGKKALQIQMYNRQNFYVCLLCLFACNSVYSVSSSEMGLLLMLLVFLVASRWWFWYCGMRNWWLQWWGSSIRRKP